MKNKIKPSSIEECVKYMDNPKVIIPLDFINNEQRTGLESHLRSIAGKNGYPSIILKREEGKLYVF